MCLGLRSANSAPQCTHSMSEHSKIIRLTLLNFRSGRWRGNFTITNFLPMVGAISAYLLCIPIR
ncbi:hypothetical protein, partial [Nostoc commune]|uniref:hypothetical protein n=1 Tax=Nostoc commune TaxID=1178 RepID=UPI001E389FE0